MSGTRTNQVQQARRIAFDVIRAVSESDAYANLLLPARLSRARLSPADSALATELTYGTLRMMGYYDRVIAIAAKRSVDEIDAAVLDVLRLGTHQLLSMRVPQHAAVNESVALARRVGSRSSTGFCNAVLREISRATPEQWRVRVLDAAGNQDDRLAAEFSHPTWIVRAFRQALDAEGRANELSALLAADNVAPHVNFAALPSLATAPSGSQSNEFSPIGFQSGDGDPSKLVTESGGTIRVQDEGSQLAALALTRARPVRKGEEWLDLCAGPGGKTAILAAEALAGGARLIANELVPARANLVRRAIAPIPLQVDIWERDGTTIGGTDPERFDRILLDAPCTGLGALRRRPEARWRKTPRDVAELGRLQRALLEAASEALKPGGLIAYVTCSPHIAETRMIVADAVASSIVGLREVNTAAALDGVALQPLALGDGLHAQLWPHRHHTDAMFIALLEKPKRGDR